MSSLWVRAVWLENGSEEEGVVPDYWVNEEMRKVFWPYGSYERALRKKLQPSSSWQQFDLVKIKCRGDKDTCEGYDFTTDSEAASNTAAAMKNSGNFSQEPPKKKKASQLQACSSFNALSIDNIASTLRESVQMLSQEPLAAKTPSEIQNVSFHEPLQSTSVPSSAIRSTPAPKFAPRQQKNNASEFSSSEKRRSSNIDGFPISEARFQRKVLYKLSTICEILEEMRSRGFGQAESCDYNLTQLKNTDDFEELEKELRDDEEKSRALIVCLKQVGGETVADCTRNTLRRLMSHELMSSFNLYGKGKKKPFSETNIYQCVMRSVGDVFRGETEAIIKKHIQTTLKHAPERVKETNEGT